jgi:hypothetical protein
MATKLETFLSENKIDSRRVVAASHEIERLRREDREIKLKQRQAKKSEEAKPQGAKPRSGRPLAPATLDKALNGKAISGPAKSRLLRAINSILEQRKKEPVTLKDLFEPPAKKAD